MNTFDALRIVKDNLDIVLIVTAAYGLAAWLIFDHANQSQVDEHDELGTVTLDRRSRVVEPDDSCVVTPAHTITPAEEMEKLFGIKLDAWQREMVNRRIGQRRVVNG